MSTCIDRGEEVHFEAPQVGQTGRVVREMKAFGGCFDRALATAIETLATTLLRARIRACRDRVGTADRQRKVIERLLDGSQGKPTSSTYVTLAKGSEDTLIRDIKALIDGEVLAASEAGGAVGIIGGRMSNDATTQRKSVSASRPALRRVLEF